MQYQYDGNGNPTLYRGVAAAYDARNRLISWGKLRAGYRSDGKRAWKIMLDDNGQEVSRKYFLYDGDLLLCELDGQGRVTSTSTWGANGLVSRTTASYAQDDTATTAGVFYAYDERGSVSERVTDNGQSTSIVHTSYDTWGSGSSGDSMGFGGKFGYYTDIETGLVLCTHRDYDPTAQRWVTRDPISYEGGINVYRYVNNNPTNWVDEHGQAPKKHNAKNKPKPVILTIITGTRSEQDQIKRSLSIIWRTKTGRKLRSMIIQQGDPVNIVCNQVGMWGLHSFAR